MTEAIERYVKQHNLEEFAPKVVLFDMDGVLYDSMWNHALSWQESMAHYGIEMSQMDAFKYEGMRGVETIKLLIRQQQGREADDEEAAMMYKTKAEYFARKPQAGFIPGIHKLQELLCLMGLKLGVVTGSGQPSLISRIQKDFQGLISPGIIVTANDVRQGKPKPAPYLMGIKKADDSLHKEGVLAPQEHLTAQQTIVIENAPLGVHAGRAAGCFTIAVNTGPLPDDMLSSAGAHLVVKSMEELHSRIATHCKEYIKR